MKIIHVAVLALSLMLSASGAEAQHEKSIEDGFRNANSNRNSNSNRNVTGGRRSASKLQPPTSKLYEWVN